MPGKKKMKKMGKRLDKEMTPVDEELLKSLRDRLAEMKTKYHDERPESCQKLFIKKYVKLIHKVHYMETKLERHKKIAEVLATIQIGPFPPPCEEGDSCEWCFEPAMYKASGDIVCHMCYERDTRSPTGILKI
jgi:hypothetical protein